MGSHLNIFSTSREIVKAILSTHILLLEDYELNQQVAIEFFGKSGLEVCVVNDGKQVVNLVQ
jgi:CheY-like chemotaxis protein